MGMETIVELLSSRLEEFSGQDENRTLEAEAPAAATMARGAAPTAARKAPTASAIAGQLVSTALRNGLTLGGAVPKTQDLAGGNTAMQVSIASTQVDFVFKMDKNSKLIREARTIEDLRADPRLGSFSSRLPKVYATYDQGPPYAYLMEWFDSRTYPSIKQIFFDRHNFPSEPHSAKIGEHAVDALAEAYAGSRDDRMQVRMMGEAYYQRIEQGLTRAMERADDYAPRTLRINGRDVRSWRECLDIMHAHQRELQALAPPFVSVVHGDPNPGNILVKRNGDLITDVKFIDLKDWKYGDYLFDIAKLTHFLLHTGPLEELQGFENDSITKANGAAEIQFRRTDFPHVRAAVQAIEQRAAHVAADLKDPAWQLRYQLAMASNLLGLVRGRLDIGFFSEALILYAEGMLLLDGFVTAWQAAGWAG